MEGNAGLRGLWVLFLAMTNIFQLFKSKMVNRVVIALALLAALATCVPRAAASAIEAFAGSVQVGWAEIGQDACVGWSGCDRRTGRA